MSLSVIDNHIMLPSVHCSVCPRFYEYHIHLVGIEKFYSISSFTESGFAEFHDLSGSTFFQDISFSWFCNIERVAVIRYFGTHIVNQNATRPNKISVKIFNFEVVSLNWFSTLFSSDSINICLSTVQQLNLITNYQFLCSNPALALHEEGMADGSGNGFALDLQVYQLVLFVAEKANNTFQGAFTSCGIFGPYQLIRLDFLNRNQPILSMDQRASHKAVLAGNTASDETANGTTKETICSAVNSSFERSVPATGFVRF